MCRLTGFSSSAVLVRLGRRESWSLVCWRIRSTGPLAISVVTSA